MKTRYLTIFLSNQTFLPAIVSWFNTYESSFPQKPIISLFHILSNLPKRLSFDPLPCSPLNIPKSQQSSNLSNSGLIQELYLTSVSFLYQKDPSAPENHIPPKRFKFPTFKSSNSILFSSRDGREISPIVERWAHSRMELFHFVTKGHYISSGNWELEGC